MHNGEPLELGVNVGDFGIILASHGERPSLHETRSLHRDRCRALLLVKLVLACDHGGDVTLNGSLSALYLTVNVRPDLGHGLRRKLAKLGRLLFQLSFGR